MVKDPSIFKELPVRSIKPRGWLKSILEHQRDGLTGHLEVAGYPFDTKGWQMDKIKTSKNYGADWWPYEQYAYWVDGMLRCGHLLGDKGLLEKAAPHLAAVLGKADKDGYLGPASLKNTDGPGFWNCTRWPHAVIFRAVMADYLVRPKKSTLDKMVNHYLSGSGDHSKGRNIINVEIMAWLIAETGNKKLLSYAESCFAEYQKNYPKHDTSLKSMASKRIPADHGVNYNEISKLGAVLYLVTGKKAYLEASQNAFEKLEKHHELVSGVPSSTEHLEGIHSRAGSTLR